MLSLPDPEQVRPPSKDEVCAAGGDSARPAGAAYHPTELPPPHFTGSPIVAFLVVFLVALFSDAWARSCVVRGLPQWHAVTPVFLRSPISAQSLGLFFDRLGSLQARGPPLLSV